MITNYLKKYFKERNISQYEIEEKTNISQSKISLILNNKRRITAEELLKISIIFDINLENIKKEIKTSRQT